jgi:hypothetical protein
MRTTFPLALATILTLNPFLRPEARAEEPLELAAWQTKIEELLDEMRHTVRRRDQMAFAKEAADLIKRGATPWEGCRAQLGEFLGFMPAGILLNSIVRALVDGADSEAINILFQGLSRTDFQDLKGRDLGEGQTQARHQILEFYVMQLGDQIYERGRKAGAYVMSPSLQERLVRELGSEDRRRIRCAAYLLGGARCKEAAPAMQGALGRLAESPQTRAVLIEALGRTDPSVASAEIEKASADKNAEVRMAALPVLGTLATDAAKNAIEEGAKSASWAIRRAAVEALRRRRDAFAMDVLMSRFPKETLRLQHEIIEACWEIAGPVLPPDPKEWRRWWPLARKDFKPAPVGGDQGRGREKSSKTKVVARPQYFGLEVWSSQLALVFDISGSMTSSNLNLGTSGVQVAGKLKSGSPFEICKDQIKTISKTFKAQTQFMLVAFNHEVKPFQESLVPGTAANVKAATIFLDQLKADGGTNIYDALRLALKSDEVDTIYLLSDGEPTDGARTEDDDILSAIQLLNRFRRTKINTVQIGEDSQLMRELAKGSGGIYRVLEVKEAEPERKP